MAALISLTVLMRQSVCGLSKRSTQSIAQDPLPSFRNIPDTQNDPAFRLKSLYCRLKVAV
jgi:hypothetical protein